MAFTDIDDPTRSSAFYRGYSCYVNKNVNSDCTVLEFFDNKEDEDNSSSPANDQMQLNNNYAVSDENTINNHTVLYSPK